MLFFTKYSTELVTLTTILILPINSVLTASILVFYSAKSVLKPWPMCHLTNPVETKQASWNEKHSVWYRTLFNAKWTNLKNRQRGTLLSLLHPQWHTLTLTKNCKGIDVKVHFPLNKLFCWLKKNFLILYTNRASPFMVFCIRCMHTTGGSTFATVHQCSAALHRLTHKGAGFWSYLRIVPNFPFQSYLTVYHKVCIPEQDDLFSSENPSPINLSWVQTHLSCKGSSGKSNHLGKDQSKALSDSSDLTALLWVQKCLTW